MKGRARKHPEAGIFGRVAQHPFLDLGDDDKAVVGAVGRHWPATQVRHIDGKHEQNQCNQPASARQKGPLFAGVLDACAS